MNIRDRITTAIPQHGCELKALRKNLSDIQPGPFECALVGLRDDGVVRILAGRISIIQPAKAERDVFARKSNGPKPTHPWKHLLLTPKGEGG